MKKTRKGIGILLAIVFLLLVLAPPSDVQASNTPSKSGVWQDLAAPSSTAVWANPHNAYVSDSVAATASVSPGTGLATHYLYGEGFGFGVPAGSTVNGIVVSVKRKADYASQILDKYIQLIKGDTVSGNNKASATYWGTSYATVTYGNSSNLGTYWGLSFTSDDVNSSYFGVAISAYSTGLDTVLLSIDYVNITVYFSAPNPATPSLTLPGNTSYADQFMNTFTWTESSSSISYYQIQVSTVKTFSSTVLNASSTSTAYAWVLASPLSQQAYYWRVRAISIYDTISSWSGVSQFYPTATLYLNINYWSLDKGDIEFSFVKTFVNGTQYSATPVGLSGGVFKHWNLTVTDYFFNIIFAKTYLANATPTTLSVQLQLVSTTLQSYGLTNAEIFSNVTMSDTFTGTDGSAPDVAKWSVIGTASIQNNRLRLSAPPAGFSSIDAQLAYFQPTSSTLTVWVRIVSGDPTIYMFGFPSTGGIWWRIYGNVASGWGSTYWQGGATFWGPAGGTVAVGIWYKIVVVQTPTTMSFTIYNPDGSVNYAYSNWYDLTTATWMVNLRDYASAAISVLDYDLFIAQGNTGYSKTLTFYDSANILLMPDDYVFNGTAWNGVIGFQSSAAIALTNRLVQLVADARTVQVVIRDQNNAAINEYLNLAAFNITYHRSIQDGAGVWNTLSPYMPVVNMFSSEMLNITVRDWLGNYIVNNQTYTYSPTILVNLDIWDVCIGNGADQMAYIIMRSGSVFLHQFTYRSDIHWLVIAGNYNLTVIYPAAGNAQVYYNLSITGDYGIKVSSDLIADLYSATDNWEALTGNVANIVTKVNGIETEVYEFGDSQIQVKERIEGVNYNMRNLADNATILNWIIMSFAAAVVIALAAIWERSGTRKMAEDLDHFRVVQNAIDHQLAIATAELEKKEKGG